MNTDTERQTEEEYVMPSAEAVLAGTLALMTGHAQSTCAHQQGLMAAKIGANLWVLASHPILSPNFQAVAERMRAHWTVLAQPPADASAPQARASAERPPLWHTAAAQLQ